MGIEGLNLYQNLFNNNSMIRNNNNIIQENILNTILGVNNEYNNSFSNIFNNSLNERFISKLEECQKEEDNCKSSELVKNLYESYKQNPLLYGKYGLNALLYGNNSIVKENNKSTNTQIIQGFNSGTIPEEGQIEEQISQTILER